jgi:hypothetical protein
MSDNENDLRNMNAFGDSTDKAYANARLGQIQDERYAAERDTRSPSKDGDSGFLIGLFALGLVEWLIQRMALALPLWLLFLIAAASAYVVASMAGKWFRQQLWASKAVSTGRAIVFSVCLVLFFAMFYDFHRGGYKVFVLYVEIAIGLFILLVICALFAGLAKSIFRHPVRSIVILAVGGFLVRVLFFTSPSSPPPPVTKAVESPDSNQKARITKRKNQPKAIVAEERVVEQPSATPAVP